MVSGTATRVRKRVRRGGFQPRTVAIVAIAWTLLWDRLTWGNVVNGVLIGLAVTVIFPLPATEYYGYFRPLRLLALMARFIADLVQASVRVAVLALRRQPPPRGSIIEVRLRTHSDLYLTLVSVLVALVPGSVVVEARRQAGIIYVHDIDAVDPASAQQRRMAILRIERDLVRAIGSPEEIREVDAPLPHRPAASTGEEDK